jgi:hypothetical protein
VGWGFSSAALRLLLASSPFLIELEVGLGACIGDADLAALARACPHLQRLTLRFAAVSGAGAPCASHVFCMQASWCKPFLSAFMLCHS